MGGMGYGQLLSAATGWLSGMVQAAGDYSISGKVEGSTDDIRDLLNLSAEEIRQLAGELDFPEVTIDPLQLLFAFANPNANPALSASTVAALQGLGMPIGGVMQEGSPQARLMNQLGAMNLTKAQFNAGVKQLGQDGLNKKGEPSKLLTRAATAAGYSSLDDFLKAQSQYETQISEMEARYAPLMREVEAGRFGALSDIAKLQSNFITPTAKDISDLEQRVIAQRTADIDLASRDAREAALQQANVMGYNPARVQGDIEERRLNQIYDLQQSDGLERALRLLGGEQDLQRTGLATLQGSLGAALAPAQAAAGLYSQGVNSMGNLAMNQALAMNQNIVNSQFFNAQQQTNQQMTNLALMLQALGLQQQGGMIDIQGDLLKDTRVERGIDSVVGGFLGGLGGGGGGGGGGGMGGMMGGLSFT